MGNTASDEGALVDIQCCATRGVRDRMVDCGQEVTSQHEASFNNSDRHVEDPSFQIEEASDLYGVGLVFRTTREGKLVVSSFIRDSSAFECGLVRDGGCLILHFMLPLNSFVCTTAYR